MEVVVNVDPWTAVLVPAASVAKLVEEIAFEFASVDAEVKVAIGDEFAVVACVGEAPAGYMQFAGTKFESQQFTAALPPALLNVVHITAHLSRRVC